MTHTVASQRLRRVSGKILSLSRGVKSKRKNRRGRQHFPVLRRERKSARVGRSFSLYCYANALDRDARLTELPPRAAATRSTRTSERRKKAKTAPRFSRSRDESALVGVWLGGPHRSSAAIRSEKCGPLMPLLFIPHSLPARLFP